MIEEKAAPPQTHLERLRSVDEAIAEIIHLRLVNKELLQALEVDLAWFIARPKLEGSYTRAKAIEDLIAKARGR